MFKRKHIKVVLLTLFAIWGCKKETKKAKVVEGQELPGENHEVITVPPKGFHTPVDMVWISGGNFHQGALSTDTLAMGHERPRHKVWVDGFFMDIHEVTNGQFKEFVESTGYITVAERKVDWEQIRKQLPLGAPKPHDSILQPGSMVFQKTQKPVTNFYDYSQWWEWRIGTNWKHPKGPKSNIEGKEGHPVVHIAHEDALAYCEWAGKRLPTEAEWEYAAKGSYKEAIFTWGDERDSLSARANTWEGEFPISNSTLDGYERSAPVMSYPPNDFGLYDMAGNVWEWTSDWYNTDYYKKLKGKDGVKNPLGAIDPYNPRNPRSRERVLKGGSFLCSDSYCASYRPSARMGTSPDSGMEHLGFRTVIGRKEYLNDGQ